MATTIAASVFVLAALANPSVAAAQHVSSVTATRGQAVTSPGNVIVGATCPDVMVIAARGTGEAPSDWTNPSAYTGDANKGAGATLFDLYNKLNSSRPDPSSLSLEPVMYPVPNTASLRALTQFGSDAQTGGANIVADIQQTDVACGHTVRYVLAGYSLGAWTVHDALNELTAAQLGEVAGVALFGDPKFLPNQPIDQDFVSQDTNHGMATGVDTKDNSVPAAIATRTGSWCFPDDPVCQVLGSKLAWADELKWCIRGSYSLCAHFQYANQETREAAAFLGPLLPKARPGGGPTGWAIISTGYGSACAVRNDQTLWCWGDNSTGQLGTGDGSTWQTTPTQVGTAANWAAVSVGYGSACAIRNDQTLWCWGGNSSGELGTGDTTEHDTPTQVGTAANWASVSTGALTPSACATRTNGTLWCWGYNSTGQLGTGDTTQYDSPTEVGTATNWAAVSVGSESACATRTDGTLWCWGSNSVGQLGTGDQTDRLTPTQVGTAPTWAAISVGFESACAMRTDGTLWCWGANFYGVLGTGDTTSHLTPTQVGVATNWAAVSEGSESACAIRTDGTLWCWGDNNLGQLGTGDTTQHDSPTKVGTATNWAAVSAGENASACATRIDGTLWCWGDNYHGQLGTSDTTDRLTPTQVG